MEWATCDRISSCISLKLSFALGSSTTIAPSASACGAALLHPHAAPQTSFLGAGTRAVPLLVLTPLAYLVGREPPSFAEGRNIDLDKDDAVLFAACDSHPCRIRQLSHKASVA